VYRWLRRLVTMNNDFVMEQIQHDLEFVIQDTAERPTRVSYSGCGKVADQLFLNGSMNMSEFVEFRLEQR
jgi:hypothetical protein